MRPAPNEAGRTRKDVNGLIDCSQINPSLPRTGWYRNPGDAANPIWVSSENTDGRFVRSGSEAIWNNVSRIRIMYIKPCRLCWVKGGLLYIHCGSSIFAEGTSYHHVVCERDDLKVLLQVISRMSLLPRWRNDNLTEIISRHGVKWMESSVGPHIVPHIQLLFRIRLAGVVWQDRQSKTIHVWKARS